MSNRTAQNSPARGLVEEMAIPADIREGEGGRFVSFGGVVPIHCCSEDEVKKLSTTTHHYTDLFTDYVLAPLGELAYVRIDSNTAEKVFINRTKRLLITSSDRHLATWRAAPTFESANSYIAGTPIVDKDGALVSVVTAKRGNNYAVSGFDGEGGYIDTPLPWRTVTSLTPAGCIYGGDTFQTRDELREHVAGLGPVQVSPEAPIQPILHVATPPRIVLLAQNGRQISHQYLPGVLADNVQYL